MSRYRLPSSPALPLYFSIIFGVLIIMGFALMAESVILGICLICIGSGLILLRQGFEFNAHKNTYRNYMAILGLAWGKWHPIAPYTCIVITRKRLSSGIHAVGVSAARSSDYYSSLHLSDDTHLKKVRVYSSSNSSRVSVNAQRLSEHTALPIRAYNPKRISKKRSRKR